MVVFCSPAAAAPEISLKLGPVCQLGAEVAFPIGNTMQIALCGGAEFHYLGYMVSVLPGVSAGIRFYLKGTTESGSFIGLYGGGSYDGVWFYPVYAATFGWKFRPFTLELAGKYTATSIGIGLSIGLILF